MIKALVIAAAMAVGTSAMAQTTVVNKEVHKEVRKEVTEGSRHTPDMDHREMRHERHDMDRRGDRAVVVKEVHREGMRHHDDRMMRHDRGHHYGQMRHNCRVIKKVIHSDGMRKVVVRKVCR